MITADLFAVVTTFEALAVFLIALLPGAAYTFAFERQVGSFGITASDRAIRFFAASAVFQALFAGLTFVLYRDLIANGKLQAGNARWWHVELVALAYVVVPTIFGVVVGQSHNKGWKWATMLAGSSPEPRAWDYMWRQLWRRKHTAIVRLRLKSGRWVAGLYEIHGDLRSYASGYPEPCDLYLSVGVQVDSRSGAFIRDNAGRPQLVDGETSLFVRLDEVEYIDLLEV